MVNSIIASHVGTSHLCQVHECSWPVLPFSSTVQFTRLELYNCTVHFTSSTCIVFTCFFSYLLTDKIMN